MGVAGQRVLADGGEGPKIRQNRKENREGRKPARLQACAPLGWLGGVGLLPGLILSFLSLFLSCIRGLGRGTGGKGRQAIPPSGGRINYL